MECPSVIVKDQPHHSFHGKAHACAQMGLPHRNGNQHVRIQDFRSHSHGLDEDASINLDLSEQPLLLDHAGR